MATTWAGLTVKTQPEDDTMICKQCTDAAEIAKGREEFSLSLSVAEHGISLDKQAEAMHKACKGGTWCDCQHRVFPLVAAPDSERPKG